MCEFPRKPCGKMLRLVLQITVFDMNKHEDLDMAILSALLKGISVCPQ